MTMPMPRARIPRVKSKRHCTPLGRRPNKGSSIHNSPGLDTKAPPTPSTCRSPPLTRPPISPENGPDFPFGDLQVNALHGAYGPIRDLQALHLQQCVHTSTPRYASITSGLVWISAALPWAIFLPKFNTTIWSEIAMTRCI